MATTDPRTHVTALRHRETLAVLTKRRRQSHLAYFWPAYVAAAFTALLVSLAAVFHAALHSVAVDSFLLSWTVVFSILTMALVALSVVSRRQARGPLYRKFRRSVALMEADYGV